MRRKKNFMKKSPVRQISYPAAAVLRIIEFYRHTFSPDHGVLAPQGGFSRCRFYPSCSSYANDAIRQYGLIKGIVVSLLRLSRCNPFHRGGYDPV